MEHRKEQLGPAQPVAARERLIAELSTAGDAAVTLDPLRGGLAGREAIAHVAPQPIVGAMETAFGVWTVRGRRRKRREDHALALRRRRAILNFQGTTRGPGSTRTSMGASNRAFLPTITPSLEMRTTSPLAIAATQTSPVRSATARPRGRGIPATRRTSAPDARSRLTTALSWSTPTHTRFRSSSRSIA